MSSEGKLIIVTPAKTLDEALERTNKLRKEFDARSLHGQILKYANKEYLSEDYSGAVIEASKGLAERVRELTGLSEDGTKLFDMAFGGSSPYLAFNKLTTTTENSEQNGLRELLNSIFHLVRNPGSHIPKINWPQNLESALHIFTLISLAHEYLDNCINIHNYS